MATKTKRVIIIINSVIVGLMVGGGAIPKILKSEKIMEDFSKLGVSRYVRDLGYLEIILLFLLLYPKTMRIGFLLLCSYFGGAIATQLSHNGNFFLPAIPLVLIWMNVFLRDRSFFRSATGQFIHSQTNLAVNPNQVSFKK